MLPLKIDQIFIWSLEFQNFIKYLPFIFYPCIFQHFPISQTWNRELFNKFKFKKLKNLIPFVFHVNTTWEYRGLFFFFNVILPNICQLNLIWKIDIVFSKHKIGTNLVFNKHKIGKTNFTPYPNLTRVTGLQYFDSCAVTSSVLFHLEYWNLKS